MLLPIFTYAQGIKFEDGLTWEQVKQKAQMENKHIFVDAYATWCGPCKKMDKEVYPDEKVGVFFNDHFISVRLQFDSTQKDNELTKKWHPIAKIFQQEYKVKSFPTYLFFSPSGVALDKNAGYRKPKDFLILAQHALDPEKQYYTLLENYRAGIKNYPELGKLATKATYFEDQQIADSIAGDYINNYLLSLDEETLYTKDNLLFLSNHMRSEEKYFDLFCRNREKIDHIMDYKGFAQNSIDRVISIESIYPFVIKYDKTGIDPDWNTIAAITEKKYGLVDGDRNIQLAKIQWYAYTGQNWDAFVQAQNVVVERRYLENWELDNYASALNNNAWTLFQNCSNPKLLAQALSWSNKSIELMDKALITKGPADLRAFQINYMDTKANLLYKLGHKQEAIMQEEKALDMARNLKGDSFITNFTATIAKMKKNEPTWPFPKP